MLFFNYNNGSFSMFSQWLNCLMWISIARFVIIYRRTRNCKCVIIIGQSTHLPSSSSFRLISYRHQTQLIWMYAVCFCSITFKSAAWSGLAWDWLTEMLRHTYEWLEFHAWNQFGERHAASDWRIIDRRLPHVRSFVRCCSSAFEHLRVHHLLNTSWPQIGFDST